MTLLLFVLVSSRSHAVLVTINSAAGSTSPTGTSSSSLYVGLGTAANTTASTIYGADEIGMAGVITSMAFQKTSGSATTVIDSVYIFMKEVSGKTTPTSLNLTGYTLVYKGRYTNTATSGFMPVTLTTPFNYSGSANLSIIVLRNKTTGISLSYRSHYAYGSSYNTVYRSNATSFWSPWYSPTAATTVTLTNSSYRANIQFNIDPFPACTGTPTAGVAMASTTAACPGNPVRFFLSGTTLASSITYSWDTAATSSGTWALAGTSTAGAGYWTFTPPAGRTLYYRCRLTCAAGGTSVTSTTVAVAVSSPLLPPYSEDFESVTPSTNPSCASYTTAWSDGQWWYTYGSSYDGMYLDNHTPGGSNYLLGGYYLECGSGNPEYWFTPAISLQTGKTYRFSYWYVNDGAPDYNPATGAYIGTAQTRAAMSPIGPYVYTTNTSYSQYITDFTVSASKNYYLGIRIASTYNYGFAIDDINLKELPACNTATAADLARPGKANASPYILCSTPGTVSLTLAASPPFHGLTFDWQRSTTPAFTTVTAAGTGSSASNSVTAGGVYYYRCKVSCPATGLFGYSDTVKVMTAPLTPPYMEDFESIVPGSNVPCAGSTYWIGYDEGFRTKSGTYYSGYTDLVNHTPGGNQYLWAGYGLTVYSGTQDFWFTPGIALKAGSTYEFSYWYLPDGSPWDVFEVGAYVGKAQTAKAMAPLGTDFIPSNTSYQQASATYTPTANGTYYFGIYVKGNYGYGMAIDDIGINELPPCSGKPSSGGLASISPSMLCSPGSVTLSLSDLPKVAKLEFQWWECDASGTLISPMGAAGPSPVLTSGTISSGKYFRCVTHCTLGSGTDTTYSNIVKVDVGAIIPPYIETFESGRPGTNMPCASYTYFFGDTWAWTLMGTPVSSWSGAALDNHTPGGSKYLLGGSDLGLWSGSPYEYWFTPAISFTAGKLYQLSYWYQTDGEPGCTYSLGTYMGSSQTASAMTIPLGSSFTTTSRTYKEYKVQFTATASGNFYIGFQKSQSNWGNGVAIDDIGLQEIPPCSGKVAAGSIVSDPARVCAPGATAVLDLKGGTLATGLSYEWLSSNSAAGSFTATGGSTLPYTTDPLTSTVWFRAVVTCAASGLSDTTPAFRINVGGQDMPYKEDFESTATGEVPLCSDATLWGSYYYDGWYVCANGTIGGPYKSTTPGGKNFLIGGYYLGSPDSKSEDNYWFTPGLNLKAGYTYDLSFNYLAAYSSGATAKMGVYIGKSQSVSGMTSVVANYRLIKNNTFLRLDTVVKVATDGVYYLGFRKSGNNPTTTYTYEGVAFDDINMNYRPCEGSPSAGTIMSDNPSGTQYCPGKQLKLTNVGATIALVPGIQYQWQRKSLSAPLPAWASVAGATDTVLSADTLIGYEYRLAVICANTSDTAYTASFLIPELPPHPPVTIYPGSSPVAFCLGDTVKFTATNYSSAVYDWMLDGVVVPGWKFSDMGATQPGTYVVKVTSALSPCPAYSNQVRLMADDPGYSVSLLKPADSIICAGTSLSLYASASKAGVSYQWRKDNVSIPGATSSFYTVNTSGYYTITATDGSSACPAVSRTIRIIVNPTPTAVLTAPGGTTACAEDGVWLKANKDMYSYEWTRGGTTLAGWVDSAQHITASGTYSVKVRTSDGCVAVSAPVTVTILPSPDPLVTRSGNVLGTTTFPSYQWIRNGLDIAGANSQYYTITKKGVYKVRVTGTNSCIGTSLPLEAMDDELSIATEAEDQIRIYPNPTTSKVYIESPVAVGIVVKDVSGKTVLSVQDVKEIDLSNYADGVYLLILSDKEETLYQQRIIKTSK